MNKFLSQKSVHGVNCHFISCGFGQIPLWDMDWRAWWSSEAGVPRRELWKSCLSADAFLFLSGDMANPSSLYTLQFKECFCWLGSAYAVRWDVRKLKNCFVPIWVIFVVPVPTVWGVQGSGEDTGERTWSTAPAWGCGCPKPISWCVAELPAKSAPNLPSASSSQMRLGNNSSKCCWFFGVES